MESERERAWFKEKFVNYLRTKRGNEFQDLFCDLMELTHPQGDFIRTRPWGNIGDRKNDGFLKSARTLFQVYAPDEMTETAAIQKIQEDFSGALPYWGIYFDSWVFVHNAFQGLGPGVERALLELERTTGKSLDHWGPRKLVELFEQLPRAPAIELVGHPPAESGPTLLARFGLAWVRPLPRLSLYSELQEPSKLEITLKEVSDDLHARLPHSHGAVFHELCSIFASEPKVKNAIRAYYPDVQRIALALLEQFTIQDVAETVQNAVIRILQGIVDDQTVFEQVRSAPGGDLRPPSGSPAPGSIAISLLEREIGTLRAELGAAQAAELNALQAMFVEGRREVLLDRLQSIRNKSSWENLNSEFQAEVFRLNAALLIDLDAAEAERLGQKAVDLAPKSSSARRLLAIQKMRKGDFQGGLAVLGESTEPNDIHLKAEAHLVQGQFDEARTLLDSCPCTAEKHRLLALIQLHQRRPHLALEEISRAESLAPASYTVLYSRAIIRFYTAVSQIAIPPRPVMSPSPFPFELFLGTSQASLQLEQSYEFFSSHAGWGQEEKRDYRCWRLACLLLAGKWQNALNVYEEDPGDVGLIRWMLASQADFDLGRAMALVETNLAAGFEPGAVIALAELLCRAEDWERLDSVMRQYRSDFVSRGLESTWITWVCQSLVSRGDFASALSACPARPEEPELIYLRSALLSGAAARGIIKSAEALDFLRDQYDATKDGVYLLEACRLQLHEKNWTWIVEHTDELVEQVGNSDVMAMCLHAARCLELPEVCQKLLERSSESDPTWFLEFRLFALKGTGRWKEAIALAEGCWQRLGDARSGRLLAHVYADRGEHKALAALARKLEPLPGLDAKFWLAISQKVAAVDSPLAKRYWLRALESDIPDELVSSAYFLGSRLGLSENPKALSLMRRFQKLAMESQHGAMTGSLSDLKEFLAGRRQQLADAEQNYLRGAPVAFLVAFGVSLPWLYHDLLTENREAKRRSKQAPVFFRSGVREDAIIIPADSRLHVDVTAVLLAQHMGVLEQIREHFGNLFLPPSLILALEKARDDLQPTQPELATALQIAARELDNNLFRNPEDVAPAWRLDFPGESPADGVSVVSANGLLLAMVRGGKLSDKDFRLAQGVLGSCWGEALPLPALGEPILLSWIWARLLAQTGLLRRIGLEYTLVFPEEEAAIIRHARASQERSAELESWLSNLIELLSSDVELVEVPQTRSEHGFELATLLELFHFKGQPGDVIWVDDRFTSMHPRRDDGVPIVGLLDLLSSLVDAGKLSMEDFHELTLEMRRSNLCYLPVDRAELGHWLDRESSEELMVLRRGIAANFLACEWLLPPDSNGDPKEWRLIVQSHRGMAGALVDCFRDLVEEDRAFRRADRLLQEFFVELSALRELAGQSPRERSPHFHVYSIGALIWEGFFAFPRVHDEPRRERLFRWIRFRLLRLRAEEPGFVETLALQMIDFFRSTGQQTDFPGPLIQLMVQELPEPVRSTVTDNQIFMDEIGARFVSHVEVGDYSFDELDFYRAVQQAFREGTAPLLTAKGRECTVSRTQHQALCLEVGAEQVILSDPTLTMLGDDSDSFRKCLLAYPWIVDGPPDAVNAYCAELEAIDDPVKRLRSCRSLVEQSPSHRYQRLHHQVKTTRRSDKSLFEPVDHSRLALRYGLDRWTQEMSIDEAIADAVERFGGDLSSRIERAWAFPVPLPFAVFDEFLALSPDHESAVLVRLESLANSPVSRAHLLRLMLRSSAETWRNKGCSLLVGYLDADALPWVRTFLTIARWSIRRLGTGQVSLALAWAHAHELSCALVLARAHLDDVRVIFEGLLEQDAPNQFSLPTDWRNDVANPEELEPRRYLATTAAYLVSCSPQPMPDAVLALQRLVVAEDGVFEVVGGSVGSNLLNSWLAPGQRLGLLPLLGQSLDDVLSRESIEDWAARFLTELEASPTSPEAWLRFAALVRGRNPGEPILRRLSSVAGRLNAADLRVEEPELSLSFITCVGRSLTHADLAAREGFLEKLLQVTDHLLKLHSSTVVAFLIYDICNDLWRADGLGGSVPFCLWLEKFVDREPELASHWYEGLSSLAWELPVAYAPSAWLSLVNLRSK